MCLIFLSCISTAKEERWFQKIVSSVRLKWMGR